MTFQELYTKSVVQTVKEITLEKKNQIFVILGQADLIQDYWLNDSLSDSKTFLKNGSETVFDKSWFTRIFTQLNTEKELHILSYAQFSYLINYIDNSFFKERVVIIRDNLRLLYPIDKNEYLESIQNENIEERPDALPIYQSEQIQVDDQYYYSVKLPDDSYIIFDLFNQQSKLEKASHESFDTIDISSDNLALDLFLNQCIKDNDFGKKALVKIYPKQPISDLLLDSVSKINFILNQFGGQLFELKEETIQEDFTPSEKTSSLLKKYWGANAGFRALRVYKNPDLGNQITEISQGLIVETIINEYENSLQGEKTRDLFLTAPTGAGKSLLFQIPAFYVSAKGDITIVVSPLIALMKDQVNAIISERHFEKIAYLNSELSLIDREKVIENCHNGKIDILYMSPELLMSYDISHFIGDRKLGLLVVDEAHLITTWGRDFRVDYWFLGNYVRKIRKYHKMSFPMLAVTATAIYGGTNDMVFDSIDSLFMRNPHVFVGQVKREDITFAVNNYDRFERNYERSKLSQTVDFIKRIHRTGLKTLVYAPYTKHIRQIIDQLRNDQLDIAAGYYGSLPPEQKELAFREFKSGTKKIMISTKAFGMGVDISDIELVYHHAPSGLLPDYVQEIGRVARKIDIQGFAALNYSSQDQRFTKALHGMSALRQFQIKEVLKKIHKAYIKNNKSRNLLLSVDDFGHIFENSLDLDQKVLTALMMIEKDYLAKNRFNVLIARPKKLFVKVFARVSDQDLGRFKNAYPNTSNFIASLGNGNNIIEVNLDELWYKNFNDKSFPLVKRAFYTGYLFKQNDFELVPQLKISFEKLDSFKSLYDSLNQLFDHVKAIFNQFDGSFFNQLEFIEKLTPFLQNKMKAEKIGKFILSSYSGRLIQPGVIEPNAFLQQRREIDGYKYRVFNNQYLASFTALLKRLNNLFSNTEEFIVNRFVTNKESNSINYVRLGYFLEMLELGTFEIKGGENPMVFIRINDPLRIERDSNSSGYSNTLLSKTLERHHLSNQIFDHFFLRSFNNNERWNFIEDFFLGTDVDTLLENHKGGDANDLKIVEYLKENSIPLNTELNKLDDKTNVHIFQPDPNSFYKLNSLLTIKNESEERTMKVSKWLAEDVVLFHKTYKRLDLKIDKEVFKIIVSKLKANHFDYFKKTLGLNMRIEFKGYDGLVKASVPYQNDPVNFYKWWLKNSDQVHLSFKNKIELLNKIILRKPEILTNEHKRLINK